MELIRCILHIMDTAQNLFAPSEVPMEKLNEEIEPILMSKLKRIFKSQNKRQATFDNSDIEKWIFDYKTTEATFEETSKRIAQRIFEEKRKYNVFHSSDFIFCEVKVDDIRYLVGIDNANTQKLTHVIHTNSGKVENEFLLHKALFSESLLKDDRIFIIEYATSALQLIETPYHNTYVFEDSFNGLKAGMASEATVIGLATTNSREAIAPLCHCVLDDFTGFTYDKMLQVHK